MSNTLHAQQDALNVQTLTLAEIRQIAGQNNPAVQQAANLAESLRGLWLQAGLKENPTVGYVAEELSNTGGKHGVSISQPIVPKSKLTARQATVDREYKAALQMYQIQRLKVENDALMLGYKVAFAERKLRVMQNLLQIAEEAKRAGAALLEAKELSRAEYLEMKIQAERTRIAFDDTKIAWQTATRELAILLGMPEVRSITVSDQIESIPPEFAADGILQEIRSISPELRQAYANVETAKAKLRQECKEAGIDYDTNAVVAYNTETNDTEFSFGVAVPIKMRNKNQGNIQYAKAQLAAANRNVERTELLISSRFEKLYGDYLTARNRVTAYQDGILAEAKESLDLTLNGYKRGEQSSLELLNAQRTLISVQVEHLDNMCTLMETRVLLSGSLLSGGLEKPEL
ncbi:MAG: TolC family protein [Thermoguttaceae bacterium]